MEIAKLEDLPRLTKLFCEEVSKSFSVEQEKASGFLLKAVKGNNSEAWISKDGFMIGVVHPSPHSQKVLVANCLFVRGKRYKKIFEAWAKEKGANLVVFNLPKHNKGLKNDGYKVVEVRHVKEI